MDLNKRKLVITCLLALAVIVFCVFSGHEDVEVKDGNIYLFDSYDTRDSSYEEFAKSEAAKDILKKTYAEITSSDEICYYEYAVQPVEILGRLCIDERFTPGETKSQVNQTDEDGSFFTTLKSVQVDGKFAALYGVEEIKGMEWKYRDVTDIFLGSEYKGVFSKGDIIEFRYVGLKIIRCRVAGFIKQGAKLPYLDEEICLDQYIVMPPVEIDESDSLDCVKVLLTVKSEGVIHYESQEEYETAVEAVNDIKRNTGFRYGLYQ